jgi:hypothetical protein
LAWGGSLNNEGSEYLRIIRAADRTLEYLESLKEFLSDNEKKNINKTIEIITDHINRLTQGRIEDS